MFRRRADDMDCSDAVLPLQGRSGTGSEGSALGGEAAAATETEKDHRDTTGQEG